MVLGEMGEERGKEMRDHRFGLIMLSSLVFFNLQFITYTIFKNIIAHFDFCFLLLKMQCIIYKICNIIKYSHLLH